MPHSKECVLDFSRYSERGAECGQWTVVWRDGVRMKDIVELIEEQVVRKFKEEVLAKA
jgi:hypothetical protein